MAINRSATLDFVQSARGVVGALDMVKTAIAGGDPGDINFAIELLDRSADSYLGSSGKFERFGFDERAAVHDTAAAEYERLEEELLASALLDAQVGNSLIAAGLATGEPATAPSLDNLEVARDQLDELAQAVGLPLGRSPEARTGNIRFGFDELPSVELPGASENVSQAKKKYEEQCRAFLNTLLEETRKVISEAVKGLESLDVNEIGEAFGLLKRTAAELPSQGELISKISALVSKGYTLFKRAYDKILRLLGEKNTDLIHEKAQEVFGMIRSGESGKDPFIRLSFGLNRFEERLKELLEKTSAEAAMIDLGARQVGELRARLAARMALLRRLALSANWGGRITGLFLPKLVDAPFFGAFFLLLLAYTVLTGMDFADTIPQPKFVDGVVIITERTLG